MNQPGLGLIRDNICLYQTRKWCGCISFNYYVRHCPQYRFPYFGIMSVLSVLKIHPDWYLSKFKIHIIRLNGEASLISIDLFFHRWMLILYLHNSEKTRPMDSTVRSNDRLSFLCSLSFSTLCIKHKHWWAKRTHRKIVFDHKVDSILQAAHNTASSIYNSEISIGRFLSRKRKTYQQRRRRTKVSCVIILYSFIINRIRSIVIWSTYAILSVLFHLILPLDALQVSGSFVVGVCVCHCPCSR